MKNAGWSIFLVSIVYSLSTRADERAYANASLEVERASGAETCIDQSALERAVEKRLGRSVFVKEGADINVRVQIKRPETARWLASLELRAANGERIGDRELSESSQTCVALSDSVTLVVALFVDTSPDAVKLAAEAQSQSAKPPAVVEPAPAKPPPAPPQKKPEPPSPQTPEPKPKRAEPWKLRSAIYGSVGYGALPAPAFGMGLDFGVTPPRFWEIRASYAYWFERRAERSDAESGADVRLQRVGIALCPLALRLGAGELWACGGLDLGWAQLSGYGFQQNRDATELLYGVNARSGIDWPIFGPVSFRGGLTVRLPLQRNRLVFSRPDGVKVEVYEMGVMAVEADVGLSVGF